MKKMHVILPGGVILYLGVSFSTLSVGKCIDMHQDEQSSEQVVRQAIGKNNI